MDISVNLLLLAVVLCGASALTGAGLALLGVFLVYVLRLLRRVESRGALYLADADNERARQLRAAFDMATGITFMRQALAALSPELAQEFIREEPKTRKEKQ